MEQLANKIDARIDEWIDRQKKARKRDHCPPGYAVQWGQSRHARDFFTMLEAGKGVDWLIFPYNPPYEAMM